MVIIYLLGVMASFIFGCLTFKIGEHKEVIEVTVADVLLILSLALCSWLSFIIGVGVLFGNKVIFRIKRK